MSNTPPVTWSRLWGACGAAAATLAVLGHLVMPSGHPEGGDAATQLAWIIENAAAMRLAATLGLVGGLLMVVFGQVISRFIKDSGHHGVVATASGSTVAVTGTVIGLGYLILSIATWADTVPETGALTFVPAMLGIGAHLAVSGWVLALPAVIAYTMLVRTRRVIGTASILATVALGMTLALPSASWGPGAIWFLIVGSSIVLSPSSMTSHQPAGMTNR